MASPRRRCCSARSPAATTVFLARHGHGHTIPPHRVNYRANLWALKRARRDGRARRRVGRRHPRRAARRARAAASADRLHARPRIDVLRRRRPARSSTSISRTRMRRRCATSASPRRARRASRSTDGGVYAAVSGPRLETAAEIDRLERDGATLVGMTGMPEAVLARELDLPYVAIAVVVNHAAGRGDSSHADLDGRHRPRARDRRWTRSARCSITSRRCSRSAR